MHAHRHTPEIGCYSSDLLPREREFQTRARKDSCNWEGDQEPRTEKPERDQESRMFKKPVVWERERTVKKRRAEKRREEKEGARIGLLWSAAAAAAAAA